MPAWRWADRPSSGWHRASAPTAPPESAKRKICRCTLSPTSMWASRPTTTRLTPHTRYTTTEPLRAVHVEREQESGGFNKQSRPASTRVTELMHDTTLHKLRCLFPYQHQKRKGILQRQRDHTHTAGKGEGGAVGKGGKGKTAEEEALDEPSGRGHASTRQIDHDIRHTSYAHNTSDDHRAGGTGSTTDRQRAPNTAPPLHGRHDRPRVLF
jgi:hypothetical protein